MSKDDGLYWHFLPDDGRMQYGKRVKVVAGKTYKLPKGQVPELCHRGFHAAEKALDALGYAPGSLVCFVRLGGTVRHDDDKSVATERTVIWMADASRVLREFALWVATEALKAERKAGREPDKLSWAALKVVRKWLDGKATDVEMSAAWSAADRAARSAARSAAWGAADRAARSAARSAAWGAARSAAWSAAWSAADRAAWSRYNAKLTKMLMTLESPKEGAE